MTETYKKIQTKFKQYKKQIRDIWESYNLIDYYMPSLHEQIKKETIETLKLPSLLNSTIYKNCSVQDTLGAIQHLILKANPRRSLIDTVSTFEDFLCKLLYFVYMDYPSKLLYQHAQIQTTAQEIKLLTIIVESSDKSEMIDKIIEEKARNIFYGNPLDFFIKDKGKLEFGDYFVLNHKDKLIKYQEITACRNVLIHNDGKIDRKYIREVKNSSLKLKQSVSLSRIFIRESIALLEGLAAASATLVLKNIYKQEPQGPLAKSWISFNR